MVMLDIGAGARPHDGCLAVDIRVPCGIVASVEFLPFRDCVIEKVIMWHLIEHVNALQATSEVRRALKSNGELWLRTPNALSLMKILRYFKTGSYSLSPDHVQTFGAPELKQLITRSKMHISSCQVRWYPSECRASPNSYMRFLLRLWRLLRYLFPLFGQELEVTATKLGE
jgi:hypothetical protein